MAADSAFPPDLVDKQVAVYAAIARVAEVVAAEPKRLESEEALTTQMQQALDDAMAEHRLALEQARAAQSKAVDELYSDTYWKNGWAAKVGLEKIARKRFTANP